MPLLNYTTEVPTKRTVTQVQDLLVKAGARQLMVEYGGAGDPIAVAFLIDTPHGPRQFALPIQAHKVEAVLRKDQVAPRYQTPEHAQRVAWRIVKDWLEAQLALIATEMVSLDQVMLPYMRWNGDRTVYELYLDQQLALPAGDEA